MSSLQKQEKPKFVLCATFAENGNTITGDSSGNILVWGKGMLMNSYLWVYCVWLCVKREDIFKERQ